MIVQSGADNVLVHRDIVGRRDAAIGSAIHAAQIDMQIFGLRRPIAGQREFQAAADGPVSIGGAVAGKAGGRGAEFIYA